MDHEALERYLDGLLDAAAAEEFERELARSPELARQVAAQSAVDAFLQRRFAEPVTSPTASIPMPVSASPMPVPASPGRTAWLAAAAALLLGLASGFALRGDRGSDRAGGPLRGTEPIADAGIGAGVGPATPEKRERSLVPMTIPDLGALYSSLAEGTSELLAWGGPPDATLASRLADRYDECLDMSTSTCALLGPYATKEWPSAAVLVAFCEGIDGAPTLLVVDDQTMRGCGLTPHTGGVSPFYKEVNGLAVWEVTDAAQPRLLDSVRSCAD